MSFYTQDQITRRNKIIQSQKLLWKHLDMYTINNLIHLFDMKDINSNNKIIDYIDKERIKQGLNTTNVTIKSEIDGEKNGETDREITLHLRIIKGGKELLHLSIHLSPESFKPQNTGVIHIVKNIYSTKPPKLSKKALKRLRTALIAVHQPIDKPNSLEFTIADGYTTSPVIQNVNLYDTDLQKEMDVILKILNRLFDEDDKEYYIGNRDNLIHIHTRTNDILENMNLHTQHVTRKNKGVKMYPSLNTSSPFNFHHIPRQKSIRQRNKYNSSIKRYSLYSRYTKKKHPK